MRIIVRLTKLMASVDAQNVAKEVLEKLGKGKKIVLGKILKENGYAQNTADNPKNVLETKSYKDIVDPVVKAMVRERNAILKRLPRVRNSAKYRDLTDGLDKLTKNIQLLSGKETESVKHNISNLLDEIENE